MSNFKNIFFFYKHTILGDNDLKIKTLKINNAVLPIQVKYIKKC